MHQVLMPRVDPAMQSGRIVDWLKKEGETVSKGDPLALVEGEKTTFEVYAPVSGVVRKICRDAGSDVPVAHVIAFIGSPDEPLPSEEMLGVAVEAAERREPEIVEKPPELVRERWVIASPAARRLARERGVDLSQIRGTGPGGRVTREDVLRALELGLAKPATAELKMSGVVVARVPEVAKTVVLSGIRKAAAERLAFGFRTFVPVQLEIQADAEELLKLRERLKAELGHDISFTALVVKAVAKALEADPTFNSSLEEDRVKIFKDINVAVAINTPEGLVTPVIPHGNEKTIFEISQLIEDLSARAAQRRLSLEDLTGGTFTVTNLGQFDVERFVPVINPPNTAILGVGRVMKKPVVEDDRIEVRRVLALSLVFDHRVTDGVPAARLLRSIKELLEEPSLL